MSHETNREWEALGSMANMQTNFYLLWGAVICANLKDPPFGKYSIHQSPIIWSILPGSKPALG